MPLARKRSTQEWFLKNAYENICSDTVSLEGIMYARKRTVSEAV